MQKAQHDIDTWMVNLPEPYHFINECLQQLILKPVFQKVALIEERRKTAEYEGNVKEIQATGQLELNGVTCIGKIEQTCLAGGLLEKMSQSTEGQFSANTKGGHVSAKVILGDKFGNIHLLDASRKSILDKKEILKYKGRRIISIATCCLEWVDTRLVYFAVAARASPIVSIFCFKNSESKLINLYSLNVFPELENIEKPEQNEGQTYDKFPFQLKFSVDFEFLAVTKFDGSVQIFKMPPVIDPMTREMAKLEAGQEQAQADQNANQNQGLLNVGSNENLQNQPIKVSGDLDWVSHSDLDFKNQLLASIPPLKLEKFIDPFKYTPSNKSESVAEASPLLTEVNKATQEQTFILGKFQMKDLEGGDAGGFLKQFKNWPQVYFVRSSFCGKYRNQIQHSEQPVVFGNPKQMKEYMVTSSIILAYYGTFDVRVYNLQSPDKDNTPYDYSQEYYSRTLMFRKNNSKKKKENNLASLVKQIQQKKDGITQDLTQAKPSEAYTQQTKLLLDLLEKRKKDIRTRLESQINVRGPARIYRMPYQISCAVFQAFEDDFQCLAIGLIDGAIVLVDFILNIEKHFLEKHPTQISSMAFFEDKTLISGSVCGRVNLSDIENLEKAKSGIVKHLKCQNLMDRKVPVARVAASNEFGIGMAIDIEGNCRFYDLLRFKKFAKVATIQNRIEDQKLGPSKCSTLMGQSCLEMTGETFVAVTNIPKIFWNETLIQYFEKIPAAVTDPKEAKAAAGKKGAEVPLPVEDVSPPEVIPHFYETELLADGKYSDDQLKIQSTEQIFQSLPPTEKHFFFVQKSTVQLFRYEDVIFSIFPFLASHKRRQSSTREIFLNNDPFTKQSIGTTNTNQVGGGSVDVQSGINEQAEINASRNNLLDQSREGKEAKYEKDSSFSQNFGMSDHPRRSAQNQSSGFGALKNRNTLKAK